MLVALPLPACAPGNGEGLDLGGRPVEEGGDVPLAPTLVSIQANVFDPFCTVCHSGASAPQGLQLDAGNSFNNLVGIRSRQSGQLLVAAGSPDDSYLVRKLEGTASEGERMPLGGPPLPQSTIDFLRQWILEGAAPASGDPAETPPAVTSMDPAAGSVLPAFPQSINVGFDQELDASTVNPMTFELSASGGDGSFVDGNERIVDALSLTLSTMNPRLATMTFSAAAGGPDSYRLTVSGSGPNVLLSVGGQALDGEFTGIFPSGDGVEGGDFVAGFEVQGLEPTLDSIQTAIFGPTCAVSGCHSGPAGQPLPAGMDLTSADSTFDALVGVMSEQVPSLLRVEPGDADRSYLVQKLEGTAAAGARMPQGGPFLESATIDVIRSWIDGGANR